MNILSHTPDFLLNAANKKRIALIATLYLVIKRVKWFGGLLSVSDRQRSEYR